MGLVLYCMAYILFGRLVVNVLLSSNCRYGGLSLVFWHWGWAGWGISGGRIGCNMGSHRGIGGIGIFSGCVIFIVGDECRGGLLMPGWWHWLVMPNSTVE